MWRLPTSRKETALDVCMFRSPVTCRDPLGDESDVVSSTENFAACALTNPVFSEPLTVMEPFTDKELEAIRFTERPPITRRSPLIVTLPLLNAPGGKSTSIILRSAEDLIMAERAGTCAHDELAVHAAPTEARLGAQHEVQLGV